VKRNRKCKCKKNDWLRLHTTKNSAERVYLLLRRRCPLEAPARSAHHRLEELRVLGAFAAFRTHVVVEAQASKSTRPRYRVAVFDFRLVARRSWSSCVLARGHDNELLRRILEFLRALLHRALQRCVGKHCSKRHGARGAVRAMVLLRCAGVLTRQSTLEILEARGAVHALAWLPKNVALPRMPPSQAAKCLTHDPGVHGGVLALTHVQRTRLPIGRRDVPALRRTSAEQATGKASETRGGVSHRASHCAGVEEARR